MTDVGWKQLSAEELLERIPADIRDTDEVQQLAEHVRAYNCWGCRSALYDLWEAS